MKPVAVVATVAAADLLAVVKQPAVASVPLSEPLPMATVEAGVLAVAAVPLAAVAAVPLAEPLLHLHLHLPILDLHLPILDLDLSLPFRLPFLLPLLLAAQKQRFARPVCMPPPSLVLL